MKYTPENIHSLEPNEVFVFGSNQFGYHDGGAARIAGQHFGAVYHQPIGLVGQSYGIITLSFCERPVTLLFINDQIRTLYQFAGIRPDLIFYVTKIGTGIAGFKIEQLAEIFISLEHIRPSNIILPVEFHQQ